MIAFTCPGCHKPLQARQTLAGKKIKCPACGEVAAIPVPATVGGPGFQDQPTVPPREAPASPDTAWPQAPAGDAPTNPSVSTSEATGSAEAADPAAGLTDFLAPPQADDELGWLGKYRILKVLGHGGMGVVFQGEDPKLKRTVALKAMLPGLAASASAGKRFLREAQAMAAVEHDHIARIYQVDEDRGVPFLAMEFLKGEPLDDRLKRGEQLPVAEVLRIGREIAEALAAAHATGLIHRDIKPANVWLEAPRGRVKILDFGLARAAAQESGLTQQGAIIGTPTYMAPEQAQGDPLDARCDLFSLGVVLYRLCTGRLPFQGSDTISTLMAVATSDPAPPWQVNADVPTELSDLVMHLLAKKPAQRVASAEVVVQMLQTLEKQLARQKEPAEHTMALAAGAPVPVPPRRRRRTWPFVAAAGALVALAAAGTVLFWQSPTGMVRIEINDPAIKVALDKDGFKIQGVDKHDIVLTPGEHGLRVKRGDIEFKTDRFVLHKGKTVTLKVEVLKGKVQVVHDGKVIGEHPLARGGEGGSPKVARPAAARYDEAWIRRVAALPPREQVPELVAKLKEFNPKWDGKVSTKTRDGRLDRLYFSADGVTQIWPVRALTGLTFLSCCGSRGGGGNLADLSSLEGMKLTGLRVSATQVKDLSALRGMPLEELMCVNTPVSDLSPLKGLPLTDLHCSGTQVADLSPLRGLPLAKLICNNTDVADLMPLKGMKLVSLHIHNTLVSDLTPLAHMPLRSLLFQGTKVTDLAPLKTMPDLRVVKLRVKTRAAVEILRGIKTLEKINDKPAVDSFKEVESK